LSLFLIFSENFFKSKVRFIMTELCYEKWFTATNYDQVLMKQTKNQSTYSFAGQSLLSIQNTLLTRSCLLFNFLVVRPLQIKFELWLNMTTPTCQCIYTSFSGHQVTQPGHPATHPGHQVTQPGHQVT